MLEQRFLNEATDHPVLGPHYFAAKEAAEKITAKVQAETFEPLLKEFADKFYERLLDDTMDYLRANAEDNVQGEIWRGVDNSVEALLAGHKWALDRYALGDRYDAEKIRAAVAKHIPEELITQRIKDLEAEVAALRKDNEFYRRSR